MEGLSNEIEFLNLSDVDWQKQSWSRLRTRGRASNQSADRFRRRKSTDCDTRELHPAYEYHPLPNSRSFRLLRFLYVNDTGLYAVAILVTSNLDDCGPYVALSYTWGPAEDPPQEQQTSQDFAPLYTLYILDQSDYEDVLFDFIRTPELPNFGKCDHLVSKIAIKQNLSDFLKSYMYEAAAFPGLNHNYDIWIDAVCINQEDSAEKTMQIHLMGDIYHRAAAVLVWLGKVSEGLETFKWMNEYVLPALLYEKPVDISTAAYCEHLIMHDLTEENFWQDLLGINSKGYNWLQDWDQFLRFLQKKRWFRRCWVLQEYSLAKKIYFCCGKRFFEDHLWLLMHLGGWISTIEQKQDTSYGLKPTLDLFNLTHLYIAPYSSISGYLSTDLDSESPDYSPTSVAVTYLMRLVSWTRERECGLDTDRVFSILGIIRRLLGPSDIIHEGIENLFDRTSPVEVFTWVASLDIEYHPFPTLLLGVEPRGDRKLKELPSWVPDFSTGLTIIPVVRTGCDATLSKAKPMTKLRVHERTLTLHAHYIDVVSDTLPACFGSTLSSVPEEYLVAALIRIFGQLDVDITGMESEEAARIAAQVSTGFIRQLVSAMQGVVKLSVQGQSIAEKLIAELQADDASMDKLITFLVRWIAPFLLETDQSALRNRTDPHDENDLRRILNLLDYWGNDSDNIDRDKCVFARRLFLTAKPYIGLGPAYMQPGDILFLFDGGPSAYILRENKGNGTYNFIGDCYVLGIMDGQLMTPEFRAGFEPIDIV